MDKATMKHVIFREFIILSAFIIFTFLIWSYVPFEDAKDSAGYFLFFGYPIYLFVRILFEITKKFKR